MDWTIAISAAIQASATVVLVACTIRYVKLTSHISRATNQPEIMVSLRPHEAHVNLAMLWIENVGTGVARNVRFTGDTGDRCKGDLSCSFDGKAQLKDIGFLKNGIDVLGPGQKIDHFLVSILEILENSEILKLAPFKLTVTYWDSSGNPEDKKIFHLNFREYLGAATIGGSPPFDIARALKEIQKDLHKLITGSSKPIIRTEPLSSYRLGKNLSDLQTKMAPFPRESQLEILREMDIMAEQKEREIREGEEIEK